MRHFSLALKTSSAYARLPLNGDQLPELAVLDQLAQARRRESLDLRPRLRRRSTLTPGAQPPAPEVTPDSVAAWLRS
jgi:hypothetical protein